MPKIVTKSTYDPTKAVEAAKSVATTRLRTYTEYWRQIRRSMTVEGVHQRWAYSIASVNNAVSGHLLCYRWFLKWPPGFSAHISERQFVARMRRIGVGGQFEVRGAGFYRFDRKFIVNPEKWAPTRPTPEDRDNLITELHGLGRAKGAFALELIQPLTCTAVCHDRHMLRLYGLGSPSGAVKTTPGEYFEAEAHWAAMAKARKTSSFILRSAFWDQRFGQTNCRWWSFPFESWFAPYAWAAGFGKSRW